MKKWMVLAVVVGLALAQSVQAGEWHKLGAKTLWGTEDSAVIQVKGAPSVSELQLRITGKPIKVQSVTVYFVGGASQEFVVNQSVQPGYTTTALAIDGGAKSVERVEVRLMLLDTQSRRSATVTVMGN